MDVKRNTLVSDWGSVCVSTFIGRGVSLGGGDLFTPHSKVGDEDQGANGKDPPNCFKVGSE